MLAEYALIPCIFDLNSCQSQEIGLLHLKKLGNNSD